jgi:hypothetical protein
MLTPVNQLIAQINPIGNPALAPNFQSMTNGFTYINTLLPTIITIGFIIGAVVFIFIFISGTFGWITAGGDKAKLEAARNRITHAIVGLVIMLLVWFIIQLVNYILGINIGMVGFPPPAPSPPTFPTAPPIQTPTPTPGAGSCVNVSINSSCTCACGPGQIPDPAQSCTNTYPNCGGVCGCLPYDTVYPPQLMLHYALDDGSGLVAHDSSGNGFNGSVIDSGDVWSPAGACGGSFLSYDNNGGIHGPDTTKGGIFNAPSFTLAGWINRSNTPRHTGEREIFVENNDVAGLQADGYDGSTYRLYGGIWGIYNNCSPTSSGHTFYSNSRLNINTWYHVALTYNDTTKQLTLYINGYVDNSITGSTPVYPCSNTTWECGAAVGQNCLPGLSEEDFFGLLDDFRFYNYALSSSDIAALASACSPGGGGGNVGDPCSSGVDCTSGLCGQDKDGDTFPGSGPGTCLAAGTSMDCNDGNSNVFPGQTQYFETAISGSNYDYDCNGTNDKWPQLDCLHNNPYPTNCSLTPFTTDVVSVAEGFEGSVPACGDVLMGQHFWTCEGQADNSCGNPHSTYDGCFAACPTSNICGTAGNSACFSWRISWESIQYIINDFSGARMPCK